MTTSKGMDGRNAARIRNRKALLAAADDLFREFDYQSVTIRDIALRAKLGLGTFYNHFPDKEALFRELLGELAEDTLRGQHISRANATSFQELVEAHFRVFFHKVCEDPSYFELFSRDSATIRDMSTSPSHSQGLRELQDDLDSAVQRGILGPTDTDYVAGAIVGIAIELGARMVRRTPPDPDGATQFATRLLVQAFANPA